MCFRVDVVPDVYRGRYGDAVVWHRQFEANTVMLGWPKKRERADAYFGMLSELVQLKLFDAGQL